MINKFLYQILAYVMRGKISESQNKKFKISARNWKEEFKLPDESYSVSSIQAYFEYPIKKHQ